MPQDPSTSQLWTGMNSTVLSPGAKNDFPHLDGLRAIATLSVLWIHAAAIFFPQQPPSILSTVLYEWPRALSLGRVGVIIFFVISGFLIARSLEKKDWRVSFPIKRALRLYPAYLVSIALALACGIVPLDWGQIAANLTMLPCAFGQQDVLGIYWTLQTEVIFYALFYFALRLGCGLTPRALAQMSVFFTTVFIVTRLSFEVAVLKSVPLVIEKLPQHLGIMFFGAYLYKVGRTGMTTLPALALLVFTLSPILFTWVTYLAKTPEDLPPVMLSYLTALALAWAVIYSAPKCPRFLQSLGKISYSIYLNHALILLISVQILPMSELSPFVGIALVIAATLASSYFTYRYVELPAMRFSIRKAVTDSPAPAHSSVEAS
jgi:peptidoglycan/LPS O-acetylase OafA/YrhL